MTELLSKNIKTGSLKKQFYKSNMETWGENTEESPVRAHLKLFHLFIVPAY